MINSKRRITSVFVVLLFALGLVLPEFFSYTSPEMETEDETNTEEDALEENDARADNRETMLKEVRWSMAFFVNKACLITEHEAKELRTALELAAEKEIESSEPYLAAYYKFFKERWNRTVPNPGFNRSTTFRLVYIDGDEIPELLLVEPFCHASGVKVYTFFDDKIIEVGEFGSFGTMHYVEREGIIHSGFFNMGADESSFFRLEKGILEEICYMSEYDLKGIYEIDGVPVSKEAYHAKWNELWSDDFISIGYDDGILVEDILNLKDLLTQEAENLKSSLDGSR